MRKVEKRSDCPISYALDLLGDKWALLILRDMMFAGKKHYKDFLHAGEGIATNVLSDRLKMLETHGMITSRQDEDVRTRKIYTLTEKGKALLPLVAELWLWGARHDPASIVPEAELRERESRKAEVIKMYQEKL